LAQRVAQGAKGIADDTITAHSEPSSLSQGAATNFVLRNGLHTGWVISKSGWTSFAPI